MQLENKSTMRCREGTTPKVIQRHAGTLLLSSERCQESQGRGGGRKTAPGLKLETNRLWEQAPLPIATGHFLPLLALCRQDLRPLPSRKGFAAWSQAPPAPHRFNFSSRTGGGGERGRSLLQGHSTQAPALRCLLQAWRNLYLYLTGTFQPQSRAVLLGPTHTQFPFSPLLPSPHREEIPCTGIARGFTQLLPQARQNSGNSKPAFPLEMLRIGTERSRESGAKQDREELGS